MTSRHCLVPGCSRPHRSKGYCSPHYDRVRKHGDPLADMPVATRAATPEESWASHVEPLVWSECLIWTGGTHVDGYGLISVGRESVLAHRYAYEREHGVIPDGRHVDHICHTRCCVNVEHLRLVTPAQNTYNRAGVRPNRKHDLPRNIYPGRGGYAVRVTRGGVRRNGWHRTLEGATALAQELRAELFGELQGRG